MRVDLALMMYMSAIPFASSVDCYVVVEVSLSSIETLMTAPLVSYIIETELGIHSNYESGASRGTKPRRREPKQLPREGQSLIVPLSLRFFSSRDVVESGMRLSFLSRDGFSK